MSLNRYATQRDANEPAVVAYAEAHGYSVEKVDEPCDLLVGKGRMSHLVEVKLPLRPRRKGDKGGTSHSRPTDDQERFAQRWRGCYHLVRSGEDLVAQVEDCRKRRDT